MTETEAQKKKVFIKTYGCQMNVYDSERMTDTLAPEGWVEAASADDADLVILNTCHIREKASEKVYSELGRMRVLKQEKAERGEPMLVAVAGCVAQAEGVEIARRAPVVDMVFGPQSYHHLPELVARTSNGARVIETEFPVEDKFDHLAPASRAKTIARGLTAFLTVQEGCDKFCTFCVVPYTRGSEASRPVDRVLAEARRLAEAGVREVTLLGQNVNGYHGQGPDGDAWGLGRLCRAIAAIPGLDRIRYTTSHPRDMDDDLIAVHRDLPEMMPWLHLPVQSGSDRILEAMNRRHTRAEYVALVEKIRAARPDIALSCDFIVGFPGETEADFRETLSLLEEVGYASSFSFKYSARPGTPASTDPDQIAEEVKVERLARLQEVIDRLTREFNRSRLGMTMDVLLEKKGRKAGQLAGRSPWLQAVHLDAPEELLGRIVPVKIDAVGSNSLSASLVSEVSSKRLGSTAEGDAL